MQINIIYVAERMEFTLDDKTHILGPGVYGMANGQVKYLYEDTDIGVDEAIELAERKMRSIING